MLGQTIGADVIVQSGISEGERVIIDGVQLLHDGSRIALGKKPSPGSSTDSSAHEGNNKK